LIVDKRYFRRNIKKKMNFVLKTILNSKEFDFFRF